MRTPQMLRYVLLIALAASACGPPQQRDAKILASLAKNGCNQRIIIQPPLPFDSMPRAVACTLMTSAVQFVGRGGAVSAEVQPSDTAQFTEAAVSTFDLRYPDGPRQLYWLVEFGPPVRGHSLVIRIDRVTGDFEAKWTEPLPVLPARRPK
jgi:hypothetical protein